MKKILLTIILGIFLITLASASLTDFETIAQNDCINISQTCATCTYVNISSVSTRENSNLISNVEMTSFGNSEWRYEFCNTSYLGRYDVKGQGDINGVDSSFAVKFYTTTTGIEEKSFFLNPILIFLTLFALTFIILGIVLKLPALGFIGSILFILSGMYVMIYGFGDVINLYTQGVAMALLGLGFIFMFSSAYEWFKWGDEY